MEHARPSTRELSSFYDFLVGAFLMKTVSHVLLFLLVLVLFESCAGRIRHPFDGGHGWEEQARVPDGLLRDAVKEVGREVGVQEPLRPERQQPEPTRPDVVSVDQKVTDTGKPNESKPEPVLPDLREPLPEPRPEPIIEKKPEAVGTVPVFVAQGDIGRTMLSCDDGLTWRANRSWETEGDPLVCGKKAKVECYNLACDFLNKGKCETKTPCDCDHHPGAPQGIAFGDGWFVATWGWGPPGVVMRSQDGVVWDKVINGSVLGGIAFGKGVFVTGSRSPQLSSDGGKSWKAGGKADLQAPGGTVYNVRQLIFADVGGGMGRFLMTGASADKRDILWSADKGKTWQRPTTFDRLCASGVLSVASGGGKIVIVGRDKMTCLSADAGKTFKKGTLPETPTSTLLWDGSAFVYWTRGKRYRSTDGTKWTATATKLAGGGTVYLGAVARSQTTGTYVGVLGGWKNWYSKQLFYRSTDGINWAQLATNSFTASHRIRHIGFGRVKRSAKGCP